MSSEEDSTVRNRNTASSVANGTSAQLQQMPTNDVQLPHPPAAEQPAAAGGFFSFGKSLVVRLIVIYCISSFFKRGTQPTTSPGGTGIELPAATNLFSDGVVMNLFVYVTETETLSLPNLVNYEDSLVWRRDGLTYGDWGEEDSHLVNIHVTPNVSQNGSLFVHVFFIENGMEMTNKENFNRVIRASQRLNKYKRIKYRKTSNLITGETNLSEEQIKKAETMSSEIVSHWHPNLTISMVYDASLWTRGSLPPPMDQFVEFVAEGNRYKPLVLLNTYWNLIRDYYPINNTLKELPITFTFQPLSLFKWQIYAAQNMKKQWPGMAIFDGLNGDEDEDQDSLKEALLDTNPYLLGLTFAISLLHSVFEFLAFKNDIQFWNNRQSLEGLSVRSVFFNVVQSLIVLLFVFDNETNFVIKVSCCIGLCIEMWKITKVVDISLNWEWRILGIPMIRFKDKGTYVESMTKKYDQLAFRYLSVLLFPLLAGYCVYSLIYNEHKGYYSFVLSMLYGFLLTFGFIMMTPQLFINYKLKSVAHLPWRMLTYKALNTFIDDIFAFVIKMPTLYRIGCLRDDVIFFIFLYQRYVYRVDPSRVNEFGFSQEMADGVALVGTAEAVEPQNALEDVKETKKEL